MVRSDRVKGQRMHQSNTVRSIRCAVPLFLGRSSRRLAAVLMLCSLGSGCNDADDAQVAQAPQEQTLSEAPRLQIVRPEPGVIQESITSTGTIGAAQTSNIGVVTPGIVERVFVKVGDRVKKGQPLFRTRQNDYEIGVHLATANLAAAEARAEQARLDYERATDLLDKKFISQAQLDSANNALTAARAEVDVAKASLAQAEQSLADTVVAAPYDGVVTARNVDEGTYKSAQTFSADSSVIQLQQIDVVVAVVRVPEVYLSRLELGTPAELFIDGLDDLVPSEIWVINDKVDPQSRTVEVRFALTNEDYRIKPGLFVRAEINPPGREALLLDQAAVLDRAANPYVFVIEDGEARRQAVVWRDYNATRVEIVSGLDPTDEVLTGPDLARLVEGRRIADLNDAAR